VAPGTGSGSGGYAHSTLEVRLRIRCCFFFALLDVMTAHQLLSFFLKGLSDRQKKSTQRRAKAIRDRVEAEDRCMTPWEDRHFAPAKDCLEAIGSNSRL
jgi:hypothetical protein